MPFEFHNDFYKMLSNEQNDEVCDATKMLRELKLATSFDFAQEIASALPRKIIVALLPDSKY